MFLPMPMRRVSPAQAVTGAARTWRGQRARCVDPAHAAARTPGCEQTRRHGCPEREGKVNIQQIKKAE